MKNKLKKTMTALCAALILMGGFSVPAYAQGAATEPPAGDATNDSNVVVEEKEETPPLTPKGNATLVDDYGGNKQLKLQDELHALDLGADDYLTKPCNMSRLLARIKNLLRRKEEQVQQGLLDGGGFLLDPNTFTIYVGNSSYLMPPNEGKILLALLKNSPKIVSKKELCIRLWGTEEFIDENALQVNFTRLRKTLREFGLEERIETVRGQGYRLKEQVRL